MHTPIPSWVIHCRAISRNARLFYPTKLPSRLFAVEAVKGRLCCKSRKLQGHEFFAKTRNGKQSPIRITSIALPKSPVSLTCGDEVPHIFTRKPRQQPAEFLITSAKRLLQHNRPVANILHRRSFVSNALSCERRPKATLRHRQLTRCESESRL